MRAVISVGGILVVVGIGAVALLLFVVMPLSTRKSQRVLEEHPNVFEDVHALVKDILLPLEFEEKKGAGRAMSYQYSRVEFSVEPTWDVSDSLLYLTASSKSDRNPIERDFVIESPLTKGDQFKSAVAEKINEWLTEKKIK